MDANGHLDLGKYSEGQPIKSIFVPHYGLQGQHFSCHVTWFPDYELESMNIKLEEKCAAYKEDSNPVGTEDCSL